MPRIVTLAGEVGLPAFQEAVALAARLGTRNDLQVDVDVLSYFEPDFVKYRRKKAKELGGKVLAQEERVLAFLNDTEFLGGLEGLRRFARDTLGLGDEELDLGNLDAEAAAAEALAAARADTGHSFCYFELEVGKAPPQRLVFELYDEICPRAVDNFKRLCTSDNASGVGYSGSSVHRVVPGGWFQGGDVKEGAGDGNEAADGGFFPDESFAVRFDAPGILAMANDGPHTNGSQFFVTFAPLPWLDCQAVAFGRIVEGLSLLDSVENVPTQNGRPTKACRIAYCGVVP